MKLTLYEIKQVLNPDDFSEWCSYLGVNEKHLFPQYNKRFKELECMIRERIVEGDVKPCIKEP